MTAEAATGAGGRTHDVTDMMTIVAAKECSRANVTVDSASVLYLYMTETDTRSLACCIQRNQVK